MQCRKTGKEENRDSKTGVGKGAQFASSLYILVPFALLSTSDPLVEKVWKV